jgi:hypothetical protein
MAKKNQTSLFKLIKKTSENQRYCFAYNNVAAGTKFCHMKKRFYEEKEFDLVLSLKANTIPNNS